MSVLLLLASCKQSLSPPQQLGVNTIQGYYGGIFEYEPALRDGKLCCMLQLSKSPFIDQYKLTPYMPASRIAYLFYTALQYERSDFKEIHVRLKFTTGLDTTFEYTMGDLEAVHAKYELLTSLAGLIAMQNFETLSTFFDETIDTLQRKAIIDDLQHCQQSFGDVRQLQSHSFLFYKDAEGLSRLHLAAIMLRQKYNNEFSIDTYPSIALNKIFTLKYSR